MIDELVLYLNQFLGWLFAKLGIRTVRDRTIRWATQYIHDLVEKRFNEDRIDERLVQHTTFVFNRIALKIQDGHISQDEAEEIIRLVRRFIQVYRVYRKKTDNETAEQLLDIGRHMEALLS